MEIKFYQGEKLLAVSNSLPQSSDERDRHIMAMVLMVDDKWDRYTVDRERIIVNKIDHLRRMAYVNNVDINNVFKVDKVWKSGVFYSVVGENNEIAYEKLKDMNIFCPKCGKPLIIDWYGIYHACYNSEENKSFNLDYDLYELYHLRKYNQQFWKEINDHNV